MRKIITLLLLSASLFVAWFGLARGAGRSPQVYSVRSGQTMTIWRGWNVTGNVVVHMKAKQGMPCAHFRWVVMGVIHWDLGLKCKMTVLAMHFPWVYTSLDVSYFKSAILLSVSDSADVAGKLELDSFMSDF